MDTEKDYNELWTHVSERFKKAQVPMAVLLELTKRCPMDCRHCYLDRDADLAGELTLAEITTLFDDLQQMGVLQLTLTGGEPMLRKDFWEILEAARARGFYTLLYTTGAKLDGQGIARLKRLNVAEVHVSLYAARPDIHDTITCRPGSFAKSLSAISRMREIGLAVRIKTVVMRPNIGELHAIAALANKLGCSYQFDTNLVPAEHHVRNPLSLRISQDELNALLGDPANVALFYRDGSIGDACQVMVNTASEGELCNIGRTYGTIDSTGLVQPCGLYPAIDSIRKRPFSTIWKENEELQRLRAMTYETQEHCAACELVGSCTPCAGFAKAEGGNAGGCSSGSRRHAIAFARMLKAAEETGERDN